MLLMVLGGDRMLSADQGVFMPSSKTDALINDIAGKIQRGELQPGDRIPSAAQLRAEHGVSITVVRRAIDHLKTLGLVEGVPGVGVFVSGG